MNPQRTPARREIREEFVQFRKVGDHRGELVNDDHESWQRNAGLVDRPSSGIRERPFAIAQLCAQTQERAMGGTIVEIGDDSDNMQKALHGRER